MAALPTRWERRFGPRVARFLGERESDLRLVAAGTEGRGWNLLWLWIPQLMKARFLVITIDAAYLLAVSSWSNPRDVLWRGEPSEIDTGEHRRWSSIVVVGGRPIRMVDRFRDRLNEVLNSRS